MALSDLLYADDVLIFTNGADCSLRHLMQLLHMYECSSGQLINTAKSGFYLHDKIHRRAAVITQATGLTRCSFPLTYLGVPTFYGRAKSTYFEHLVDNVRKALECWKAKILSFGG